MTMSRSFIAIVALFSTLAFTGGATNALAQPKRTDGGFPTKPVRFISPVAAGSASDTVGRLLAQRLSEYWGQQIIIENRAGVNGVVGAEFGSKAVPDGYTLTIGNSGTHVMNAGLYKKLSYDPIRDFAAVAQIVTSPMLLVSSSNFAPTTVQETIALAKVKSLNFGGPGATGTLASMLFNQQAGVNIVVVPFKGSNAAEVSILQGEIQLLFSSIGGAVPFLSSGKMRALAVTSLQRLPQFPNVPTLDESGLKGYEMDFWIGLFAPAATPKELVARINQDVALVSAQADLKEKYNAMGYDVVGESPERFSAFLQRSVDKYTRIIREFGMSAE